MENQLENFDKFNYYVGQIFGLLVVAFPRRVDLNMIEMIGAENCPETYLAGRWTGKYLRNGEVENVTEELDFLYDTIRWLYDTGYLIGYVGSTQIGRKVTVTLSPQTLEILKKMPESVSAPGQTLGQEIAKAAKSAAKAKLAELGGKALSYAVKAGWEAVTGAPGT